MSEAGGGLQPIQKFWPVHCLNKLLRLQNRLASAGERAAEIDRHRVARKIGDP
jgi:hypothetical protein